MLALARPDFDITHPADLLRIEAWRPDLVVNAAAWTDVDGCARDPETAARINGHAAGAVASAAWRAGAKLIHVSTNEVFDGAIDGEYVETDQPRPINDYGKSKLLGEQMVAEAHQDALIVRTAWLFGPGSPNFVTKIHAAARRSIGLGQKLRVVSDEWGNPTWTPWLAELMWRSSETRLAESGIRHWAGTPATSRHGWAAVALAEVHIELEPIPSSAYKRASRPPLHAVLGTDHPMPNLPDRDWHGPTERLARDLGDE